MNKNLIFLECLLMVALIGCTPILKEEDVFLQGQQIKAQQVIAPAIISQQLPDPEILFKPKYTELPKEEKLIYKAKFLGIPIGQFTITDYGKTQFNGLDVYTFEIRTDTLPVFSKIFKTKDRYVSYFDPLKLRVVRYEEYVRGGETLELSVDFNYQTHQATYTHHLEHDTKTVPIPDQVFDFLSAGFYFRMLAWELGDTNEIKIYGDQKIFNLIALLQTKENMPTVDKNQQEAFLLKPYLFENGTQVRDVSAEVHFSADSFRTPLKAVLKTIVGNVNVVLVESHKNFSSP